MTASFRQVSEFNRGRIVACRDCGLSFREIGQRVGRDQTIFLLIFHHSVQEETADRRDRSYSPCCTTARDDRRIVCMEEMDQEATSRTVAQQIQSVMHHSVSSCTI
ncbi:transposable element Tc3 transposase [Trichonephila clavipes]|uniref:Transposable element Tc3 transposase n=1 Tax=Trichonephila clavipes TaxID=2585209 RepID=A0A8X6RZQ5_TRICX|nr:transposable element Tc3 transposase [Trichonephila clavipes]